jgi:hypothetical protein
MSNSIGSSSIRDCYELVRFGRVLAGSSPLWVVFLSSHSLCNELVSFVPKKKKRTAASPPAIGPKVYFLHRIQKAKLV